MLNEPDYDEYEHPSDVDPDGVKAMRMLVYVAITSLVSCVAVVLVFLA